MKNFLDAFLQGFGSILDIGGVGKHEPTKKLKIKSEQEAWEEDQKKIAGDMWQALNYVEEQVEKKKDKK